MARHLALVTLVALIAVLAVRPAAAVLFDDYCEDSAFDPAMTSFGTWVRQRGLFSSSFSLFRQWTRNANLTSNAVLQDLADRLIALNDDYKSVDPNFAGWTITRSSGIIIIDTNSAPNSVNPPIENHNTRYEFAKAIQCRDHGAPVVFEKYFVPRLGRNAQFFAKALQTGIDGTWFVFRINFFLPA